MVLVIAFQKSTGGTFRKFCRNTIPLLLALIPKIYDLLFKIFQAVAFTCRRNNVFPKDRISL